MNGVVSHFCNRVYTALCMVPKGYVTTYRDLARAIGCNSPRAIGQALKINPFAPSVPCHRVVYSNGAIGGFAGKTKGPMIRKKIQLLQNEGVHIIHGYVENFSEKCFVIPAIKPKSV